MAGNSETTTCLSYLTSVYFNWCLKIKLVILILDNKSCIELIRINPVPFVLDSQAHPAFQVVSSVSLQHSTWADLTTVDGIDSVVSVDIDRQASRLGCCMNHRKRGPVFVADHCIRDLFDAFFQE